MQGFGAQLGNQFAGGRDMTFVCTDPTDPSSCLTVLQYFAGDWFSPWIYWVIECLFIAGFLLGAWAALRFVQHQKR